MSKTIYSPASDPRFAHPVIDRDEWQERHLPDGSTIPYRYMHGYFDGTDVKFSFCFPAKESYQGRFQQYLSPFPGPDEEVASLGHTGTLPCTAALTTWKPTWDRNPSSAATGTTS